MSSYLLENVSEQCVCALMGHTMYVIRIQVIKCIIIPEIKM